MDRPDSVFDLIKPALMIGLMAFILGFAGLLALAWPGAGDPASAQTELAAAMEVAGPQT